MTTIRTARWLNTTTALTSAFGLAVALAPHASANPAGGQVAAGEATFSAPDTRTLQIDQTSRNAVIEWRSFDIDAGDTTRFVQPDNQSWTLNRVTGETAPSRILGTLEANGNVAIVNPDGILFGKDARVDVGGLIATTHDIANDDFMAGRFQFNRPGNPSVSIVNEGSISIADYGLGAFVAPGVRNSGVITARLGSVSLASGNAFSLDLYGDNLVHLLVDDEIAAEVVDVATGRPVTDLVKNEGRISADGGTVALTAATARRAVNSVVNNSGIIEANSVGRRGGKIVLGAQTAGTKKSRAPTQRVKVSGQLLTMNVPIPTQRPDPAVGGHIAVLGEHIEVANATIDVSGEGGGGTVLIGGDYMGGHGDPATIEAYGIDLEAEAVGTASSVAIDNNSIIRADALERGDGGKVVIWADNDTSFDGSITANGGGSGSGGFVETSGASLAIGEAASISTARNGMAGTWLLDPDVVSVGTGPRATVAPATIEQSLNNGTNVALIASKRVEIWNSSISKTSGGNATLSIEADVIDVWNSIIRSSRGSLDVDASSTFVNVVSSSFSLNGGSLIANAQSNLQDSSIQTDGGRIEITDSLPIAAHFGAFDGIQVLRTDLSTGAGSIGLSSLNSNIWISNAIIDTGGGGIDVSAGTRITSENSAFKTTGGDVSLYSRGTSLTGGHEDISYLYLLGTDINTSGGDVSLRSNTDVYVYGAGNPSTLNVVNAGDGSIDVNAVKWIDIGRTGQLRAKDVSLTAGDFIRGGILAERFTKPDVIVTGELTTKALAFGFSAQGGPASVFDGTWRDSPSYAGGFGLMSLQGFGTTRLNNALTNDEVDARIEFSNGDFFGGIIRPEGIYFHETGNTLLEDNLGIVNTKGISTISRFEIEFDRRSLFYVDDVFESDGTIALDDVNAVNGSPPNPANFPKRGAGQIFINGRLVYPIPHIVRLPQQDLINPYLRISESTPAISIPSSFHERNRIAMQYVIQNDEVRSQLNELAIKVTALSQAGPEGLLIAEFYLAFESAVEALRDVNEERSMANVAKLTQVVLEVIVDVFGHKILTYPVDALKLATAVAVSYVYGYVEGIAMD